MSWQPPDPEQPREKLFSLPASPLGPVTKSFLLQSCGWPGLDGGGGWTWPLFLSLELLLCPFEQPCLLDPWLGSCRVARRMCWGVKRFCRTRCCHQGVSKDSAINDGLQKQGEAWLEMHCWGQQLGVPPSHQPEGARGDDQTWWGDLVLRVVGRAESHCRPQPEDVCCPSPT